MIKMFMKEKNSTDGNWAKNLAAQNALQALSSKEHPHCFMCGKRNPIGFKLEFHAHAPGAVSALFPCNSLFQSYAHTFHGGLSAALIDAAMTNCLFSAGITAVTGELTVRYLQSVSIEGMIELRAQIEKSRGPLHYVKAEIIQDEQIKVSAKAKFVTRR